MSSNIKFSYFDIQAIGEPIRLLMKYGGIEFTDIRYEPDSDEWPKSTSPFGQLPLYEENGKITHQSLAIARYIATKVKLAGDSAWERMEIDAIVDTITDFRGHLATYGYQENEVFKELIGGPLFEKTIPYYLDKFEQIAKQNNGHFALGKLTWADFMFTGMVHYFNHLAGKNIFVNYPHLDKVVENVSSIPSVNTWIKSRPVTPL